MAQAHDTKTCPYCAETIKAAAIRCRFCHSDLTTESRSQRTTTQAQEWFLSSEVDETASEAVLDFVSIDEVQGIGGSSGVVIYGELSGDARFPLIDYVVSGMLLQLDEADPEHSVAKHFLVALGDVRADETRRWSVFVEDEPGWPFTRDPLEVFLGWGPTEDLPELLSKLSTQDQTLATRNPAEACIAVGASEDWIRGKVMTAPGRPTHVMRLYNAARAKAVPRSPVALALDAIPLQQWRGRKCMTLNATVHAQCVRCAREWELDGPASNAIANAQGMASRIIRRGTRMEQFGATFTAGSAGRRIASGNEGERQEGELASWLSLAACPSCRRIDQVQLKL